jgi:hypothetical protein
MFITIMQSSKVRVGLGHGKGAGGRKRQNHLKDGRWMRSMNEVARALYHLQL